MFWEPFKCISNLKKSFLPYALIESCKSSTLLFEEIPLAQQSSPVRTGWGSGTSPPSEETLACRQDAWRKWECIGTFLCSATSNSHNGLPVTAKCSLWSYAGCQLITRQPQVGTINCNYPLPSLHNSKNQNYYLPDPTLLHPKACTIWLLFWENS